MSFSKIHPESDDSVLSQLDLFATPFTQTSVIGGDWVEIGPVRDSTNGPLEFEIEGSEDQYLDVQNTLLQVKAKVTLQNGDALDSDIENVQVIPGENFMHSLFSTMSLSVNGHEVEYESNYPYRAYIETLANYGSNAKSSHLNASYWFDDEINALDTSQLLESHKTDLNKRKSVISGSKTIDMVGRLHSEIFAQHKYIIPACNLRVKLLRSDPKFCLLKTNANDNNNYKIDIIKCDLLLRKVKVNPAVATSHNTVLMNGTDIKYPINKVETQFFSITQGRQSERINLILNRQEPKRILLTLVEHAAKNGTYTKSPFAFKNFNLNSIGLTVNGHPVPNKPLRVDYESSAYIQAYMHFMIATGKAFTDEGNCITRHQYANGFAVYAFDLTGDLCEGTDVHLIKNSTTVLEVTFKEPLASTLSLFVYAEGDDIIQVNNSRVVTRASKT